MNGNPRMLLWPSLIAFIGLVLLLVHPGTGHALIVAVPRPADRQAAPLVGAAFVLIGVVQIGAVILGRGRKK